MSIHPLNVIITDLKPDDLVIFNTPDLQGVKQVVEIAPRQCNRTRLRLKHLITGYSRGCMFYMSFDNDELVNKVG